MKRSKSLYRPDRAQAKTPLLRSQVHSPPIARSGATSTMRRWNGRTIGLPHSLQPSMILSEKSLTNIHSSSSQDKETSSSSLWAWTARSFTCCCCAGCLRLFGKKDPLVQQAWREKVASCILIFIVSLFVGFLTFGLRPLLCPEGSQNSAASLAFLNQSDHKSIPYREDIIISGALYPFQEIKEKLSSINIDLTEDWRGSDITRLFSINTGLNCRQLLDSTENKNINCTVPNKIPNSPPLQPRQSNSTSNNSGSCPSLSIIKGIKPIGRLFFSWKDLELNAFPPHELVAFNGAVINMTNFLTANTSRYILDNGKYNEPLTIIKGRLGTDATRLLVNSDSARNLAFCLTQSFVSGYIDMQPTGCVASNIIVLVCMIVILGVVFVRLIMALCFSWFMASRLVRTKKFTSHHASHQFTKNTLLTGSESRETVSSHMHVPKRIIESSIRTSPNVILLVTCYSEGEKAIRGTLESLAATDYPDRHKLLLVISDGVITGSGNPQSTPDIIISMLHRAEELNDFSAKNYLAIAHGSKQHNMARVYAGYFKHLGRTVPMVAVIKCGAPEERSGPKPGNRGKRDSQLVLMNFLSRTLFNDRMTALDYDLYKKIKFITGGLTPDMYDYVLMVDADTTVEYDALGYMIQAMKNDDRIMGLCGETRIENKTVSWVTAIQVFEYYISHHLGKAFESVFGGVTCLPGCFCMYRIKARKGPAGKFIVPLLANPDIVDEYSENVVDTLHKKNLLLLGEDRFLTTLMLRTFPKRKMVFVPKAICRTTVPEEFKVLLSQRRRWINSTIHNLFELIKLRELCGIFCFSMQFVVGLELLGTVVLPCAISFTIYLLINFAISGLADPSPLILLSFVLFLPGTILVFTNGKPHYLLWMVIYMMSLPVWNFILPLYAFWHFDDFSWGETRKVEGELLQVDHSKKDGKYKVGAVTLRLLDDWIRHDRHKTMKREQRKASVHVAGAARAAERHDYYYPQSQDRVHPNYRTSSNQAHSRSQIQSNLQPIMKQRKDPLNYLDVSLPSVSASYSGHRHSQNYSSLMEQSQPQTSFAQVSLIQPHSVQYQNHSQQRHSVHAPYYFPSNGYSINQNMYPPEQIHQPTFQNSQDYHQSVMNNSMYHAQNGQGEPMVALHPSQNYLLPPSPPHGYVLSPQSYHYHTQISMLKGPLPLSFNSPTKENTKKQSMDSTRSLPAQNPPETQMSRKRSQSEIILMKHKEKSEETNRSKESSSKTSDPKVTNLPTNLLSDSLVQSPLSMYATHLSGPREPPFSSQPSTKDKFSSKNVTEDILESGKEILNHPLTQPTCQDSQNNNNSSGILGIDKILPMSPIPSEASKSFLPIQDSVVLNNVPAADNDNNVLGGKSQIEGITSHQHDSIEYSLSHIQGISHSMYDEDENKKVSSKLDWDISEVQPLPKNASFMTILSLQKQDETDGEDSSSSSSCYYSTDDERDDRNMSAQSMIQHQSLGIQDKIEPNNSGKEDLIYHETKTHSKNTNREEEPSVSMVSYVTVREMPSVLDNSSPPALPPRKLNSRGTDNRKGLKIVRKLPKISGPRQMPKRFAK